MKWISNKPEGYIGAHRAAGQLHLAAVKSHGDRLETVSAVSGEDDAAALVARLDEDVRTWPLVVTVPTRAGLHRALELPAADEDATQKMLALRLEGLFPLADSKLSWGWRREDGEGRAWVYLASVPASELAPPTHALAGAVSPELALVSALLRRDAQATLTIVTGEGEHAAVTVLVNGRLAGVAQADLEGDEAMRLAALDEALEQVEAPTRPSRLLVVGSAASLGPALAERWGAQRVTASEALGDTSEAQAIAAGAAAAMLRRDVPVIVMEHATTMSADDRRRLRRRVIQAGGWLAAALVALAAIDLYNASKLEQDQIDSVMSSVERTVLDRQRALGAYVQSLGPTPLAIIDEIGMATRGIQLDDVTYEAGGDFRLRGKLRSTQAVNDLLNAMSKMQTLDKATLVSQRSSGRDEVQFEITAQVNRKFLGGFAAPPAPAAEAQPGNRQARGENNPPGGDAPREATP